MIFHGKIEIYQNNIKILKGILSPSVAMEYFLPNIKKNLDINLAKWQLQSYRQ